MKSSTRKDTIFNTIVLVAAWLMLFAACIPDDADTKTQPVRIAFQAQ